MYVSISEKSLDEMKTETYCTSAGCMQWRALQHSACSICRWVAGLRCLQQCRRECTLCRVQWMLHKSRHRAHCSGCCMPAAGTAGCSFQGSILLMGQTTETESGASVAESEEVTGTRKSGETNSLLETAFFVNLGQNKRNALLCSFKTQ